MVNIDTVYQKVLALANKEQRGYITPQEFNLFANQAQMDIFEQYFYDINQFGRIPGNSTEYSDMLNYLEEKISLFETQQILTSSPGTNTYFINRKGDNIYKIGEIFRDNYLCEKVNEGFVKTIINSPLVKPTATRPIYTLKGEELTIYPFLQDIDDEEFQGLAGDVTLNYIKKPAKVNWTYIVVGEKALLNNSADDYQDFELHISEETDLVIKILQLAGITLKDPALYEATTMEDNKNIQQEKQ